MHARFWHPALAAAMGAGLSAVLLRRGVVMGPDSWAYWEGSVSLLERGEYAYFGGAPITAFPPLFPALLALIQAGLGVSARTLAIALGVCVAGASFAWTALYAHVKGGRNWSAADVLALLAIPATLAVSGQTLLSESLWLVLLPVLLMVLLEPPAPREPLRLVAAGLMLSGLLLSRNATIALLPGVGLLLWRRAPEASRLRRIGVTLVVVAGALVPWSIVRWRLGQLPAHPLGHGRHGLLEYSRQALEGLANGLGPDRCGIGAALLCVLAVLLAWESARPAVQGAERSRALALAHFAVLGLAGHVVLFRLTYVAEPIHGRFVVFAVVALAIVMLAMGTSRKAFLAMAVALTTVALYRAGVKARLAGIEQPTVPLDVRLSSSYPVGPPRAANGQVLVAPPTYPWIPHR